ncbi:MAG: hypothetical protein QW063_02675 [Candidatus Nanoarchaeia archaeon]
MKWLLTILFLLLPAAVLAGTGPPNCMLPTVVDGYVYFANSSAVSGANVTTTTTASDCNSWYAQSESSGYYGIPGLNIQAKTVTSTAVVFVPGKGTFDGVNSSYSPNSTLRLDVIIRPSPPILTPVPDRHNGTNIAFSWISGIEASTDTTYDQFALLPASFTNKTSPQYANLTFGSYTWIVRTCNSKVCSSSATDSFNIYNTPPSTPIIIATNYTDSSSATLKWISGIDTDTQPKDLLVDELQIARDAAFTDLLFSQTYNTTDGANMIVVASGLEPAFGTFYWRVRTCDNTGASNNCSAYATSSFFRYYCSPCPPCEGGAGGGVTRQVYVVTLNGPNEVNRNSEFKLFVNFKATQNIKEVLFDVIGSNNISCNPEKIIDYKADIEQNLVLDCKVSNEAEPRLTELILHVNSPSGVIAKKSFFVTVLGAVCGNNICEVDLGENTENCPADCPPIVVYFTYGWFWIIVLIIVIVTLIYKLWKEKKERERQKHQAKLHEEQNRNRS